MKERLQQFIKNEGLTLSKFAEAINVGVPNVSHLLSGRNNPGYEFIAKMLIRFPQVNPDWLLLGKGQMYRDGGKIESESRLSEYTTPEDKTTLLGERQRPDQSTSPSSHAINIETKTSQKNTPEDNDASMTTAIGRNDDPYMIVAFYADGSFKKFSARQ